MRICPQCAELFTDDARFCAFDQSPLTAATDPYLGRTLAGRFRLVKRLGAGATSTVYLARHVLIDRLNAIKILRKDLSLNPAHHERFLREARAVNRINHRNIVEITDVGEVDGAAYLVMEYVEGEALLAHLRRGVFAWDRAARVAMQVAAALGRAHQNDVIHRDLKPENILIVPDRESMDLVKLSDFGIAKMLDAPALTFTDQMFGTPGYIAPEYFEGAAPDGRADLYALGVVMYEMMTGKLPYDARGQSDVLFAALTRTPRPFSARGVEVPPEVEALVMRLLSRQRADRPADALLVHDMLDEALHRQSGRIMGGNLTSPPPFVVERDTAPTLVDEVPDGSALNLTQLHTREMTLRWLAALEQLELTVSRTMRRGGDRAREAEKAGALAERARELIANIERASGRAGEAQSAVDRLTAHAREFRANLGRAIDELARDRAHAREEEARQAKGLDLQGPSSRATPMSAADLTYQIDALQKRLDSQNVEHEEEIAVATARLEGSASAVRRLTHELVRTLDEATAKLR